MSNEAFARVKIDALLATQGWDVLDTIAVRFEVQLPDGTRADYVLCDRHGRSLAVIEAKRYSVNPGEAAAQAKAYQCHLNGKRGKVTTGSCPAFAIHHRAGTRRHEDLRAPVKRGESPAKSKQAGKRLGAYWRRLDDQGAHITTIAATRRSGTSLPNG